MKILQKRLIIGLVLFLFGGLASFFKLSFAWGSCSFFFSGVNIFLPLLGSFLSVPISALFVIGFFLGKKIIFGSVLTLGLPTMCATLCWAISSRKSSLWVKVAEFFLKVVFPGACIVLFVSHPVGKDAFLYSFYWFIPVILYFLQKLGFVRSIFVTALTSTFVAHAVGSVMWLYMLPMTPEIWLSLIPVVAIERLVFSCGMTLVCVSGVFDVVTKNILVLVEFVRRNGNLNFGVININTEKGRKHSGAVSFGDDFSSDF